MQPNEELPTAQPVVRNDDVEQLAVNALLDVSQTLAKLVDQDKQGLRPATIHLQRQQIRHLRFRVEDTLTAIAAALPTPRVVAGEDQ